MNHNNLTQGDISTGRIPMKNSFVLIKPVAYKFNYIAYEAA